MSRRRNMSIISAGGTFHAVRYNVGQRHMRFEVSTAVRLIRINAIKGPENTEVPVSVTTPCSFVGVGGTSFSVFRAEPKHMKSHDVITRKPQSKYCFNFFCRRF
jgi:hypothetical protein